MGQASGMPGVGLLGRLAGKADGAAVAHRGGLPIDRQADRENAGRRAPEDTVAIYCPGGNPEGPQHRVVEGFGLVQIVGADHDVREHAVCLLEDARSVRLRNWESIDDADGLFGAGRSSASRQVCPPPARPRFMHGFLQADEQRLAASAVHSPAPYRALFNGPEDDALDCQTDNDDREKPGKDDRYVERVLVFVDEPTQTARP